MARAQGFPAGIWVLVFHVALVGSGHMLFAHATVCGDVCWVAPNATTKNETQVSTPLCPSWGPTGGSQDTVSLPRCQIADINADGATLECDAAGFMHGSTWRVRAVDGCGNVTSVSLPGAAETCYARVPLHRPPFSCGTSNTTNSTTETYETVLRVSLVMEGGAAQPKATAVQEITWQWRVNLKFEPTLPAPDPYTAVIDSGFVGTRLTITVWYSKPTPAVTASWSAAPDFQDFIWTSEHCLTNSDGVRLCARSLSMQRPCEQGVLSLRVQHECTREHALNSWCVEEEVSTKQFATPLTFPCETEPVVVDESLSPSAVIDSVVAHSRQVNAKVALTTSAGLPQPSYLESVVLTVFAAVPLAFNMSLATQQVKDQLVLAQDGHVTGFGVAAQLAQPDGAQLHHDLSITIPLGDPSFDLNLQYGHKAVLEIEGLMMLEAPTGSVERRLEQESLGRSTFSFVLQHNDDGIQVAGMGVRQRCRTDCEGESKFPLLVAVLVGSVAGFVLVALVVWRMRPRAGVYSNASATGNENAWEDVGLSAGARR